MIFRHVIVLLALLLISSMAADIDIGEKRLHTLIDRVRGSPNKIINFTKADFDEYVMKYPRPYDVVIFFGADQQYQLVKQLYSEYEYLVKLYDMHGAIDRQTYPTFFTYIDYSRETAAIFRLFEFQSVPNMVVSKPHMAVISELEQKSYFKEYTWEISYTDNHVTTHKMLEFVNKRTKIDVEFRHTDQKIYQIVGTFALIAIGGVLAYLLLKPIWNNWVFWFIGSIAVYLTCCSGIVYCKLHDVPWTSRDQGGEIIFSGGSREQTGIEGWVISGLIIAISLMFVLIGVAGEKCSHKFSSVFGMFALLIIYLGVTYLEKVYRRKGWYGPSYSPPQGYLKGPLNVDQGNNI